MGESNGHAGPSSRMMNEQVILDNGDQLIDTKPHSKIMPICKFFCYYVIMCHYDAKIGYKFDISKFICVFLTQLKFGLVLVLLHFPILFGKQTEEGGLAPHAIVSLLFVSSFENSTGEDFPLEVSAVKIPSENGFV